MSIDSATAFANAWRPNPVEADYAAQCQAARALAEAHFDARKVLASLIERALS